MTDLPSIDSRFAHRIAFNQNRTTSLQSAVNCYVRARNCLDNVTACIWRTLLLTPLILIDWASSGKRCSEVSN
jgi:hypothetical protein